MTPKNVLRTLAVAPLMTLAACAAAAPDSRPATISYVGLWVTADGHIRQELLPNGRYDEARGARKSAYTGRYSISGTRIDYVDDTGFTADGEFVDPPTWPTASDRIRSGAGRVGRG